MENLLVVGADMGQLSLIMRARQAMLYVTVVTNAQGNKTGVCWA